MRRRKDGCHAAFDAWCGMVHNAKPGTRTKYFNYERLLPLLRRRSLLLQTLISLTCDGAGLSPAPGLPEDRP